MCAQPVRRLETLFGRAKESTRANEARGRLVLPTEAAERGHHCSTLPSIVAAVAVALAAAAARI